MTDRPYHHGDLRAALLTAAEAELAAVGTEGFSLRAVAKRAGVSHAAPAHHFGDVSGLLTALCAEGFRRFHAAQTAREAVAPMDAREQLIASGLGYVDFAIAHRTLFRLMFASDRPSRTDSALATAGQNSFTHLVAQVIAAGGEGFASRGPGDPMTPDIVAVWAMAHGLADLIGFGQMASVRALPQAERDALVRNALDRALPRHQTPRHAPDA